MSLLSFTKCFISSGGEQAATALTTAMVKMAPETATAAELKNIEQDLDQAGQLISRLQRELTEERHAYDAINARYTQMMGAAENLQHQIDGASFLKDPLQASLATLVAQIEGRRQTDQEGVQVKRIQAAAVGQVTQAQWLSPAGSALDDGPRLPLGLNLCRGEGFRLFG